VGFENVGAFQVQQIRKQLAKQGGHLVIAKNTLINYIISIKSEPLDPNNEDYEMLKKIGSPRPELKALSSSLKGKVGLIFTDQPVSDLKEKIEGNKIATEAKVGSIAPIDFVIPPGPTGLDPSQINFFHALQMSTKIEKAQIQITKDFKVCTAGKKVNNSEAALLKKLGFKPFSYGMIVQGCYDSGSMLSKDVINMNPESLLDKVSEGIRNIIGLAVEIGHPTEATVPMLISNAFRNLAALSLESGYKIKQLDSVAPATQAPAKEAKEEKKPDAKPDTKAAKKEEPKVEKVEEDDVGMGDLFG